MAKKFKIGDTVFLKDRKKTKRPGKVIGNEGYVIVEWLSIDSPYDYVGYELKHKHRILMFFRYLYNTIKEPLQELKAEMSIYRMYRHFKIGNMVYLKESTSMISTCDIGRIVRKEYPRVFIQWENTGIGHSMVLVQDVEHCTGIDPNRLFKRNMT